MSSDNFVDANVGYYHLTITVVQSNYAINCSHKVIEQIEVRNSNLREELVDTKEQLNRALLDKDCLRQEHGETADALAKLELHNAELGTFASLLQ